MVLSIGNVMAMQSQNYDMQADTIPIDPKLTIGKLSNGFTYYLKCSEGTTGKIEIRFIVKAGFNQEIAGQTEVSHVIEHAAFGKTTNIVNVNSFLKERGLIFGSDFGASTGLKSTNYQISIPSSDANLLSDCIAVVRDWCSGIILDSGTIETERGTVLAEHGNPDDNAQNPSEVIIEYENERSPAKLVREIKKFSHDAIKNYYKDWYRPNLQAIVIIGDIDVQQIEKEIIEKFSDLVMPTLMKPFIHHPPKFKVRSYWNELNTNNNIFPIVFTKKHWLIPNESINSFESYKRLLITELFNRMARYRFNDLPYVDRDKILNFGHSYHQKAERGLDQLLTNASFSGNSTAQDVKNNLRYLLIEEERMYRYGFSQEELNAAKSELLAEQFLSSEKDNAQEADNCALHFIGGTAIPPQAFLEKNIPKWLVAISLKDVMLIQKLWKESDCSITLSTSHENYKKLLPDSAEFIKWQNEIRLLKLKPYKSVPSKPIISLTELKKIKFIKPELTEDISSIKAKIIKLRNGSIVVLKPTKTAEKAEIFMEAFRTGNIPMYQDDEYAAFSRACRLVSASGVGRLKKNELHYTLRNTKTIVRLSSHYRGLRLEDDAKIEAETKVADFELMLQLLYQRIVSPNIDRELFNNYSRSNKPSTGLDSIYKSLLSKYLHNPVPIITNLNKIDTYSRDELLSLYNTYFSDMKGVTFVFTGNFDVKKVEDLIIKYIGSIPSSSNSRKIDDDIKEAEVTDSNIVTQVIEKMPTENMLYICFLNKSEYTQNNLINRDILKSVLNQLLYRKLREEMGKVYVLSVSDAQLQVDRSRLVVTFSSAYGNIDTLTEATWKQIDNVRDGTFKNTDLETAKDQVISSYKNAITNSRFWQNYLFQQTIYGKPFAETSNYISEVQKVDFQTIVRFAKEYLEHDAVKKITIK